MTAYFDGALPERDRLRFETHLAACDACTRYLQQMHETIRLTGRLREEQVSPEARERLLGAFRGWNGGHGGAPPGGET